MNSCKGCEYIDYPNDCEGCNSCDGNYSGWVAAGSVSLESINAKLDTIMEHLGIVG